jgi:hypothetical protein
MTPTREPGLDGKSIKVRFRPDLGRGLIKRFRNGEAAPTRQSDFLNQVLF